MTEEKALSAFESATVVRVRPGDVLLFRCPGHLNQAQREGCIEVLDRVFPDHESLILDGGQDLAVLRPEPGLIARAWRWLFGQRAVVS